MQENFFGAFLITFLAGLSTVVGGFLTFFIKKDSFKILCFGLSFSAGVMLYVSFMEIMPSSIDSLTSKMGKTHAEGLAAILFFIGMGACALIDKLFPEHISSDEINENCRLNPKSPNCIKRMGMMTAVALTVHNFPEGLSVFVSGASSLSFGLPIAIAIALHNIPEGISVALPIYTATASRKKAIFWSFISGMAEPVGAFIGFFILKAFTPNYTLGILLAFTAGIMVFLSIDELLPTAKEYEDGHESIIGVVAGMMIMALTMFMLH